MRDTSHDGFDGAAAIFAEKAKTLRGYVRYHVVQHNLLPYVTAGKTLRILDIGGGSGIDASWLASMGHKVTLIEPSAKQQNYAQRRFNFFLSKEQRKSITFIQTTLDTMSSRRKFDVVLMHGVAMYQPEPAVFIATALRHVKRGGIISLLEKGYYGAESRAIREQRFAAQEGLLRTQQVVNNLGLPTYTFKPDELEQLLMNNGFTVLAWTGVRVITDDDTRLVEDVSPTELASVLKAEIAQGANPGIRAQGQMLHFIARKPV